jgi:hypothetical protein
MSDSSSQENNKRIVLKPPEQIIKNINSFKDEKLN